MASALSIFGADEDQHRAARSRAHRAFSPDAIAARSPRIEAIVERHLDRWPRARPTRLLPRMRALADEIFVGEVLGVRDPARAKRLANAIGALMWTPGNPPLTIPAAEQGLLGRAVHAVYRKRRRPIAKLLEAELANRRRRGEPGSGVLGLLLEDEPRQEGEALVEELLAMLMAAQEPMAAALTWLALSLGSAPPVARRLREERRAGDYEHAVVEESLRLHPPAFGMLRRLASPTTVAGLEIPAATGMIAPLPLLHRDPRTFAEPDRFLPERHLEGGAFQAPPTWPFGHGPRSCIAELLARAQLAAMARALVERFTVDPLGPPERMVLRATILVPQRSGSVRLAEGRR